MFGLLDLARNVVLPRSFQFRLSYSNLSDGTNPLVELLKAQCPHLTGKETASPSRCLPSGHLQTIYSALGDFSSVDKVDYKRKVILVPDGGTISLDFTPPRLADPATDDPKIPTILCLHGLTGGSYESYVRNCLSHLSKPKEEGGAGFRCVVVNYRGCANTPVTSPQLYSASKIADVASAILLLTKMFPQSPILGLGFSLGGCILCKYFGEQGRNTPMVGGIVVGAPFELERTQQALESGIISNQYSLVMGRNLNITFLRHIDTLALDKGLWETLEIATGRKIAPGDHELPQPSPDGPKRGTMRFIDHYIAARIGGYTSPYGEFPFPSSTAYYDYATPVNYMHGVQRPLIAISAEDDPVVPSATLTAVKKLAQENPNVVLAASPCGGHLGFFTGYPPRRWIHNVVSEVALAIEQAYLDKSDSRPQKGLGSGGPSLSRWTSGGMDSRTVEVEILPVRALPKIFPDEPRPQQEASSDRGEPQLAWLLTHVLPHAPLVHPSQSPVKFQASEKKDIRRLKLVRETTCNLSANGTVLRLSSTRVWLYRAPGRSERGYVQTT